MQAAHNTARGGDSVDVEDAARRLRVRTRARADGLAERPATDSAERAALEDEILAFTGTRQDALADMAAAEGEKLASRMRGLRPAQEGASMAITAARIALRQAAGRAGQEVTAAAARAARASEDLDAFRAKHRRDSAAHYPASPLFAFGLLAMAALLEASFSAALFAQDDAHGLLGGAATAAGLSGANVAIGFLGGFLGLRYLQHVRWTQRLVGLACFLAAVAGGLTLNGFAAAWRNETATTQTERTAVAERTAIQEEHDRCATRARARQDAESAALALQRCDNARRAATAALNAGGDGLSQRVSPQALVLLMLGLGVWTFSALKGYSGVDDPYPDYGKLDRLAADAREDLHEAQEAMRDDMAKGLNEAQSAIAAAVRRMEAGAAAMREAYNAAPAILTGFEARWRRWDQAAASLIDQYREENRAARRTPPPAHFAAAGPRRPSPGDPLQSAAAVLRETQETLAQAQAQARAELEALSAQQEAALAGLSPQPAPDGVAGHGAAA
jgi:hypothetical protein